MSEPHVVGGDGIRANLGRAHKGVIEGTRRAMPVALENVLQVSNSRVPHEEGDLERDGAWSMDDTELKGAVTYGRDPLNGVKAVVQHERMDFKHDAGRSAKFLELAINQTASQTTSILYEGARKGLEEGA